MAKTKVHIVCFLANASPSVTSLKLGHGFKIIEKPFNEGINLICKLDKINEQQARKDVLFDKLCYSPINEQKGHPYSSYDTKFLLVEKSFYCNLEIDESGQLTKQDKEIHNQFNLVHEYIHPIIQLLKLFKEGNIIVKRRSIYFKHIGEIRSILNISNRQHVHGI